MDNFSRYLTKVRSKRGWNQSELAKYVGTTQQTISRWESGKVAPEEPEKERVREIISQLTESKKATPKGVTRPLINHLPLYDLPEDRFEQFCLDLVKLMTPPGSKVHIYGRRGDKQYGIDLYAILPNKEVYTYQCKRIEKGGRFGPSRVKGVIKDFKFDKKLKDLTESELRVIKKHLLLTKVEANARERDEILKHSDWDLYDLVDIASEIRSKSRIKKLRLIDTHFPQLRYDFLGINSGGIWNIAETEYAQQEGKRLFMSHGWELAGREKELSHAMSFIDDSAKQFLIINGIGGIGKSRFVKEIVDQVGQKETKRECFVADNIGSIHKEDLNDLSENCILFVEDAHSRDDIPKLLSGVWSYNPKCKIILTTRPYGINRLKTEFINLGIDFSESVETIDLESLSLEEARKLVVSMTDEYVIHDKGVIDSLAKLTRDCPLLLVLGVKLLSEGTLLIDVLNNKDDFQDIILSEFQDAVTASIDLEDDRKITKELLNFISVVQPIDVNKDNFYEPAKNILDTSQDVIDKKIQLLENSGILSRKGSKIKIVPDLLGDQIRERATFNRNTNNSTSYADRVFNVTGGHLAANLLKNLGQLDWRIKEGNIRSILLHDIWEKVQDEFESSGIWQRGEILDIVKDVAYFQPDYAIKLVEFALKNETNVTGLSKEWGTDLTYKHVLEKIPNILKQIGYNLDYLPDACAILWKLALRDKRATNQYPEHPIRVLEDLGGYAPKKPIDYSEIVFESAIDAINSSEGPEKLIPYSILEKLLETESHISEAREKYKITMIPVFTNLEVVKPIRENIFDFLLEKLDEDNLDEAIRALKVIDVGLSGPRAILGATVVEEKIKEWINDVLPIYEKLKIRVESDNYDPIILVKLRESIFWESQHGRDEIKSKAKEIIDALPSSYEERYTRALFDDYGRFFERLDQGIEEVRKRWEAWLKDVAKETFEKSGNNTEVLLDLETSVTQIANLETSKSVSHNHFIRALIEENQKFAEELCNHVVKQPDSILLNYCSIALPYLFRNDREKANETFADILDSDSEKLISQLGFAISWGMTSEEVNDENVFKILSELLSSNNINIKLSAVNALRRLSSINKSRALQLALSVEIDGSTKLAEEIFTEFIHGELDIKDLSHAKILEILRRIENCPSIDEYYTNLFLIELSKQFPLDILDLFIRRIEKRENIYNNDFKPIPHNFDRRPNFLFHESNDYLMTLNHFVKWFRTDSDGWEKGYFGSQIFGILANTTMGNASVMTVLNNLIDEDTKESIELVAELVSELPESFIYENTDFLAILLDKSARKGRETFRIVSSRLMKPVITGMRSGTPGQPFPQDIKMQEKAIQIRTGLKRNSHIDKFFEGIQKHAEGNIERSALDDLDW